MNPNITNMRKGIIIYKKLYELLNQRKTLQEASKELALRYSNVYTREWIENVYVTIPSTIEKFNKVNEEHYSNLYKVKAEFLYDPLDDILTTHYIQTTIKVNESQFIFTIIQFLGGISDSVLENLIINNIEIIFDTNKNGYWKTTLSDCKYLLNIMYDVKPFLDLSISDIKKDSKVSKALIIFDERIKWITFNNYSKKSKRSFSLISNEDYARR